jgi:CDP-glucose 4,6-dehydratase
MKNLFNGIYANRKVFITGHTGFKGSWLCLLLHKLGADVYGYALEPPTMPSLFREAKIDELITSFIGDIRDYEKLLGVMQQVQPEIVIHMAAQSLVRESYKFPIETYSINVMGTVHLLDACLHTKSVKSIVNVTTDKCYENREWIWGYRENDILGGYDPYASSKACSEIVTTAYLKSFFSSLDRLEPALATSRAGNVIGGGDWATDRLIPDFVRAIQQHVKIIIRNPHAIRPWQYVLEPLTGYLILAGKLFTEGTSYTGAWNFGPDDNDARTVEWIVQKMCVFWGNDAAYEITNSPQPHESTYLKLDYSKAKAMLNWHPLWNLEKTLNSIIDFTKAWQNNENLRQVCIQQIEDYFNSYNLQIL